MDNLASAQQHKQPSAGSRTNSQENRDIITPYAFEVPTELYGTALASPTRRASAILLDLLLVAMLAGVSGHALALLIGGLIFLAAQRMKKRGVSKVAVRLVRICAGLLLFITLLDIITNSSDYNDRHLASSTQVQQSSTKESLVIALFTGKYLLAIANLDEQVQQGKCASHYDCWHALSDDLTDDLHELNVNEKQARKILTEFFNLSGENLTAEQSSDLYQQSLAKFSAGVAQQDDELNPGNEVAKEATKLQELQQQADDSKSISDYSIVNWVKGIAADLGLGFGWAAFYFTAFTGLFNGQTPGKLMFGIKVIKLDGSALNLWESFGRYGGYGAGLATGLLGFIQIYWDANRQAIQDKISETLVINLRRPKQQYHQEPLNGAMHHSTND